MVRSEWVERRKRVGVNQLLYHYKTNCRSDPPTYLSASAAYSKIIAQQTIERLVVECAGD